VTRLLIWRHGQTVWNATGRIQGHTDIELDEVGRQQAERAAALLAAQRPDVLVSSDLRRARSTVAPLAAATGLLVATDPRLRERGYGEWEGLTDPEVAERYPDDYRRWVAGQDVSSGGVETLAEFGKRAMEGLSAAADRAPDGTVVVVTHGGAAKRGCGLLLGWPDEAIHTIANLANCHWTELRSGSYGWRLFAHNVGVR
jgi:glucosyl-3-phosphoglycerate phosphatase